MLRSKRNQTAEEEAQPDAPTTYEPVAFWSPLPKIETLQATIKPILEQAKPLKRESDCSLDDVSTNLAEVAGDISGAGRSLHTFAIGMQGIDNTPPAFPLLSLASTAPMLAVAPTYFNEGRKLAAVSKKIGYVWGQVQGVLGSLRGAAQTASALILVPARVMQIVIYFTGAAAATALAVGTVLTVAFAVSLVAGAFFIAMSLRSLLAIRAFRSEIEKLDDTACLKAMHKRLTEGSEELRLKEEAQLRRVLSQELIAAIKNSKPEDATRLAALVRTESAAKYRRAKIVLALAIAGEIASGISTFMSGGLIYIFAYLVMGVCSLCWLKLDGAALLKALKEVDREKRSTKFLLFGTVLFGLAGMLAQVMSVEDSAAHGTSLIISSLCVPLYVWCGLKLHGKKMKS